MCVSLQSIMLLARKAPVLAFYTYIDSGSGFANVR